MPYMSACPVRFLLLRGAVCHLPLLMCSCKLCHGCVQFQVHASEYYPYLCDIMLCDLKTELRAIVRKFFLRTGTAFCITTVSESQCHAAQRCLGPEKQFIAFMCDVVMHNFLDRIFVILWTVFISYTLWVSLESVTLCRCQ